MSIVDQILSALSAYGIKPEGRDKYRCKGNPFRPGSDSNSFSVTVDGDKLIWYDHRENRGGGMIELARALNINLPRADAQPTKRPYQSLEDYAQTHGLTGDDLRAAMWRWTMVKGRPALEFPTETGKRWRFVDGQSPYYMSEPGYKRCWYGLRHANISGAIDQRWPIVIANGEISVVAAAKYGIPAICVTSGEKAQIPDELIQELMQIVPATNPIIIALDCDDKGRKAAQGMWRQLANHWQSVRAIDLHLTTGGDLADYVRIHQHKSYEMLEQLPSLPPSTSSRASIPQEIVIAQVGEMIIIRAADAIKLPPVEWIIKGEIPHRGLTVLYGPSGAGKSFVAIDYCLRIAQQSPVLYIAGEGESGIYPRIRAWCNHHIKTEGQLYLGLGMINLIDTGEMAALIEQARNLKPKLIVVDTLARSMGDGDENMTRDMNIFMARCKNLMNEVDCGLMLVHHTGKNGGDYRGSSVLRGAADSMIAVEDEDDVIRVESRKTKDARPFETRYMKLQPIETGLADMDGNPIYMPVVVETQVQEQTELSELTTKQRRVLEVALMDVYDDVGVAFGEFLDHIPTMSRPTLARILGRLKKSGYLAQEQSRDRYSITDKGRAVFGEVAEVAEVAIVALVTPPSETETTRDISVNRRTNATNATNATRATNRKVSKRPTMFGGESATHYDYEG